jgi:uncharacterized hydantoinase/oxoprolinase family protein
MTPSECIELKECLRRVSEILYNESDSESLETLEDIEKTVREQVIEKVSPEIALFLSKRRLKPEKEEKGL